jgi:hypothetical protein
MFKLVAVSIVCLVSTFGAMPLVAPAAAKDMEAFLNAPAWQLEYEVTFVCRAEGPIPVPKGALSYTLSLDRRFSGALPLDVRSGGPNLATLRLVTGSESGSAASLQQQSAITELMMRVDDIANWINGGPTMDEGSSDEAQQAAMLEFMASGTASIDYTLVETGVDLQDEMGQVFDSVRRTTAKGAGKVMPPTSLVFEIDAKSKRYMVTLPITFGDASPSPSVKWETTERVQAKGAAPSESRTTRETTLESFPRNVVVDDPAVLIGQLPTMEGSVDPSLGKISGERSVPAHYEETGRTIAGTLTFRYTLTPR